MLKRKSLNIILMALTSINSGTKYVVRENPNLHLETPLYDEKIHKKVSQRHLKKDTLNSDTLFLQRPKELENL